MPELQDINVGPWDHEKAETMAYLLMDRTDFSKLLDSQQEDMDELQEKKQRVLEKSTSRSAGIVAEGVGSVNTVPHRLRAVVMRAAAEESEIEVQLIETRDEQIEDANRVSDELLEDYSRFYDTDPEKFATMSGEQLGEHFQKVDDLTAFIASAKVGLSELEDVKNKSDLYGTMIAGDKKPFLDSAHIEVARDSIRRQLERIFGEDSEEAREVVEDYDRLRDSAYDSYTPKQLVEAFREKNYKWIKFITYSKETKEAELESLVGSHVDLSAAG